MQKQAQDIGDKKVTLSIRTVVTVVVAFVTCAFGTGVGWYALDAKADNALKSATASAAAVRAMAVDLCQLKNYMINHTKPSPYDGCAVGKDSP